MKTIFLLVSLTAATNLSAAILETISFDLSALHPGSTLSGSFLLSNSPMVLDSTTAVLNFSDPADYTPSPVTATIRIGNGTVFPFTVTFDTISFTNPSGTISPINSRSVNLTAAGMAQCASFPCSATGAFQDNSPALFSARYTIAPAATTVPEPGYATLLGLLLASLYVGKRFVLGPRRLS